MNFGLFIVVAALCLAKADILNRLEGLREKTREMFYHGFNGYLKHAFPFDELEPQSCTGLGLDHSKMARRRLGLDRVLNQNDPEGSFEIRSGLALTLIDSLDTLAFLGDRDGFHHAAKLFLDTVYNFEIDNVVLVFEINIRVLGALLSAHLFLSGQFDRDSGIVFRMGGYQGEMLKLAVDLGERLLPAFNSPTGIPYSKINLHSGLPPNPNPSNCPAAAGSFILEFGLLSFLTGDPRYYLAAKKSVFQIWNARSELGLIGYEINVETGQWLDPASTIGAGADSYYEYLLKGYILFGDPDLLEAFEKSNAAIKKHMLDIYQVYYKTVDYQLGSLRTDRIDALGAFYPSLQVLYGDVAAGRRTFDGYYMLMRKYGGLLPEAVAVDLRKCVSPQYHLRPELAESALYLYRATKDPFYLKVGADMLDGIDRACRTPYGFANLDNLPLGLQGNRMESFLLSETLKYLYLLFTPEHWISTYDGAAVFSTEAHLLKVPLRLQVNWSRPKYFKCSVSLSDMSTPQDQSQRMITFWNAGPKPSNLKAFMDTWYPSGITLPNALVSLALPATVEESILVSKQLFYMNGRLSRPKYITISPWPSLDNPSYILTGIGKHFRVKRQEVILLLRRPSRKDEILLGITQLKQKRFPILALNQFDTCLAAVDLSKSLRSVDLKGTYHAVDVLAPFLTKSETAHDYAVEGIDDSHLLQQFSAIDLVEAYRLYKEKLVYGGLPILNFYRMELPDFVYDSLLLVQERPKFCKYKKFDIK